MSSSVARPGGRARRCSRGDAVTAQYSDPADAAGYAAAHQGWSPYARYFHSRLHVVQESLSALAGGQLLDAGCGPGMLIRQLLDTRPGDFRITVCDQSSAMVEAAGGRVAGAAGSVDRVVAPIEDMPLPAEGFDVALATGVLEYADASSALRELARVVRPGGYVVVTMLNPLSPYRLFEWVVFWPALRLLGRLERRLGVSVERCHGVRRSGIRAMPAVRLRRMMRRAGMCPYASVYYDFTVLVPPLDRVVRRWSRRWRAHPETTVGRGSFRWLGTAYLVAARK